MNRISSLPPLREVIARYGLSARRSLGQNFLLDMNLTDKIVRQAGTLAGHDVLEIGPGPGGLTRSLANAGARRIVVVEKDERFLPALREIAECSAGTVEVIHADALAIDTAALVRPPARIIANLPYNVGTPLLADWLSAPTWPPRWRSLTLAFQLELAERLVAVPGTKTYGRISVLAQWRTSADIVMTIPPSAFVPSPKVTTAVVQMQALPSPAHSADSETLFRVVKTAFSQRRKMLRSSLKPLDNDISKTLAGAGVSPEARADSVSISDFCSIARQLCNEQSPLER